MPKTKRYSWKALTIGLGAVVGFGTQRALEILWRALLGSTPPKVAADRRSSLPDALSWAVAAGVGVGVARLLAIRTAAGLWEAAVHEPPPDAGLAVDTLVGDHP
jgi:Protein of unknown function (DUF4235)